MVAVPTVPGVLLAREGRSLVERLRLWTASRWAAGADPWGTRADLVAHLVQVLADAAADQEGRARLAVPRLGADMALPDQLAVMVDDIDRAGPGDAAAVALTAHLLLHRSELLGDTVPAGLADALAGDPLVLGRRACRAGGRPL